jgi:N-acyl homoserine lactone hydrolase
MKFLALSLLMTLHVGAEAQIKVYVLDGGILEGVSPERFGLKREEVTTNRLPVPCFLIVHPKGTLMWDGGAVPDSVWKYNGLPASYTVEYKDIKRDVSLTKPLKIQLEEIGYTPAAITHLVLSHYHYDHTGNANIFSGATWLVRQTEYDAMFAGEPPKVTWPATYSSLKKNRRYFLLKDEHDVFGDGTVMIKSAPGHTPGHLVLFLKLKKTGNIVLSGDLYHYAEERTLNRYPTFEFDQEQTRLARIEVDKFLKRMNAQLWIQHDLQENIKLRKSPFYYE